MTVLVVGGTGFVGGHVVHALRAEQLPVRVLRRRVGRLLPLMLLDGRTARGISGKCHTAGDLFKS